MHLYFAEIGHRFSRVFLGEEIFDHSWVIISFAEYFHIHLPRYMKLNTPVICVHPCPCVKSIQNKPALVRSPSNSITMVKIKKNERSVSLSK